MTTHVKFAKGEGRYCVVISVRVSTTWHVWIRLLRQYRRVIGDALIVQR